MHSKSGPRRHHSPELKANVLAACDEPGASISGVALAHGLNTNLVRKWRSGRGAKLAGAAITPAAGTPPLLGTTPAFVAIEMPAPAKACKHCSSNWLPAARKVSFPAPNPDWQRTAADARVLRTPQDRGWLWLLDERYGRRDVSGLLPAWWGI